MRKILIIGLITLYSLANGQSLKPEVISTSGDHYVNSKISLSWTLGEIISETAFNSNIILTQGFQQPSYSLVTIYEAPEVSLEVKLYPNPTFDIVNIQLGDQVSGKFHLVIYDMNGKLLLKSDFADNTKQIDLSQYTTGHYLLNIVSDDQKIIKTYKVIKLN